MKKYLIAGFVALVALFVGVFNTTDIPTGGMAGNVLNSDEFTVNGITRAYRSEAMTTATTTVCAVRSPINATSTLMYGGAHFTVSSTTASTVYLAKANTRYATTTNLGTEGIAANGQATLVASSTTSQGNKDRIFSPGQWFVVGMAGMGSQTYSPTGVCKAEFLIAN